MRWGPERSWRASPVDAVRGCDVAISMLPTSEVTLEVAAPAMAHLQRGSVWIDMGSNSPTMGDGLRRLAAPRGIEVIEAPVGGGPEDAELARLQLFVAGDEQTIADHRGLLEAMAGPARISYLGSAGRGYVAKLMVNLIWFGQAVAIGEAMLVAQRFGIDPDDMRQAMMGSAVAGEFVSKDLDALLDGDFLTSFGLRRCYDELVTAADLAAAAGTPFTVSAAVADVYAQALSHSDHVDGELGAVAFLESQAGRQLRRPDAPPPA